MTTPDDHGSSSERPQDGGPSASPGRQPYGGPPPPPPGYPHGGPPPGHPYGGPPPGQPYGGPPYGPGPYPPPYGQQGITAADDTTWALAAYLGQFAVGFVAPLVVYLARKDQSPFTRFHGAQALNAALTYLAAIFCGFALTLITVVAHTPVGLAIVIPVVVTFVVAHFVYLVIGAVKAGRREMYRIPAWLCWRIIR